jgi:hypothetical protein
MHRFQLVARAGKLQLRPVIIDVALVPQSRQAMMRLCLRAVLLSLIATQLR